MTFEEILDQATAMLQRRRRLTYSTLKRQFQLDDAALEDLKNELIAGQRLAVDEQGNVLVWTGDTGIPQASTPPAFQPASEPASQGVAASAQPHPREAERRQLTVLFCDLVDSTRLSGQLDPEDLREVVRAYQATCAEVIQRFDGYIAQYLGDALLVYFGYPQAHEDDAQRAIHASLGMREAMEMLNMRLVREQGVRLAIRVGIHTGPVVVGEMGGGGRYETLALGETPNIAARLQGLAAPDTVAISAVTWQLVHGYFACQDLGSQRLKGVQTPLQVYRVLGASAAQSRLDVAAIRGFTPLVGRDGEVALLLARWAQVQEGLGQVVLLSGEGGIGKSRLVEVLRERIGREGYVRLAFRCSPYHIQSALYPVIEHVQRLLHWDRTDPPAAKLDTLEQMLRSYDFPLEEMVPLFAALLSLPPPAQYPALSLSAERQKQKTLEALVAWLVVEAERQPVLAVWEDLHWADPSTLEFLDRFMEQAPTARLLTLLTCRPEFRPPWTTRMSLTQITLARLQPAQIEQMVAHLTGGKALPAEVRRQVLAKTDGVPLFVEELVKMILESGLIRENGDRYVLAGPLPLLAIPATLQDSLMARLDRLSTGRALAQLGAVLGREFTYEVLRAVAPMDEPTLQRGLAQLVEAELLYQRGVPPRSRYLFKHAMIQEAAYQALLKSTRQQYHQRIAQVLEAQFPDTAGTEPELLAYHFTEAGLAEQAIPYWKRAGTRAVQRSANAEAMAHLTQGLEVLKALPDTPERARQELDLQTTLGPVLMNTRGAGSPAVEQVYTRARELCQQVGEPRRLFQVLWGLWRFYHNRVEFQTAEELGKQLLTLAQQVQDPALLLEAHHALWPISGSAGDLASAHRHLEQGMALYDPQQHRSHASLYSGHDPGVCCRFYAAWVLWLLGYPDQSLQRSQDALALAQELAQPQSLASALRWAADLHTHRREGQAVQERAEAVIRLSTEQRFEQELAQGTILWGWALTGQGQGVEGIAAMRQGLAALRATGGELRRPQFLALLAEAYGARGQNEEGLNVLAEAVAAVEKTGERYYLNVAPTKPWSPWKPHKVRLPRHQASARAWRSSSV